jgi:hypothetical protein
VANQKRKRGRSTEEIAAMMTGYEQSGLTRREYCQQRGIALSTLDYYRHRRKKKVRNPGLVAVKIVASEQPSSPMTVILGNGRRIEVGRGFAETELARLLRVVEGI